MLGFARFGQARYPHMRPHDKDERWIRERIGNRSGSVYITHNHYDGGYEVRIGSLDFFVDYETIDAEDSSYIAQKLSKL